MTLGVTKHSIRYGAWPYLAFCKEPAKQPAYLPPRIWNAFYHLLLVGVFYLEWRSEYLML